MSENKTRVLIADDHAVVRKSIKALLESQPDIEVVATAGDGREAVDMTKSHAPDVVVMDISMPELDGIRATDEINTLGMDVLVIILSMYHNAALVQQARIHGAAGYVVKQRANSELLPAIRAARAGKSHF